VTRADPPVLGYILKGYPRISETFIANEVLRLEELGLRIRIFSMRPPRETTRHAHLSRIRARVDYLPEQLLRGLPRLLPANLVLARRQPDRYRAALALAWDRWRRSRRSATFKHLLQAGYVVQRWLPGSGVVHLHAHFAHSPASVAMFAAVLGGLPFSFTAHAKDIYTSQRALLAQKMALARFVVTCTRYNQLHLERLRRAPAPPIHTIYHGIDPDLFQPADDGLRAPCPPYRILTVARLTAKKGIATVLHALSLLRREGVPLTYTLIGDGDARRSVLGLVRGLDLAPTVHWLGTQPHEEVLRHFRQADLFALGCEIAADGDRDGIPNVLMESMAMGVPVVATRVSAIPELIEDGVSGTLVPPADPVAMAGAMRRMLTDGEPQRRMRQTARRVILQHFDNRVLTAGLAELFSRQVPALATRQILGGTA
jgi:glycosyltransferase involved in cell wall biosynthesis